MPLLGIAAALLLAAVATALSRVVPLVGAPVLAILAGIALRAGLGLRPALRPGLAFSARTLLQAGIVVSGLGLSFEAVARTGLQTLPVTLVTITVALVAAPLVGRLFGVKSDLQRLIGVGTAICGASAIAAVSAVIDVDEADVALSLATIFFFNVAAVLLFPPLGRLLHLSQAAFGVWAGTAVNDTSSVVAAGYAYGHAAGVEATIVKLARATLILPIVGAIAVAAMRAHRGTRPPWHAIVPWFILWFLAAAALDSAGFVAPGWHPAIAETATFLISAALGAIGLQTDGRALLRAGIRPLGLGFVLWVLVATSSLAVQHALPS